MIRFQINRLEKYWLIYYTVDSRSFMTLCMKYTYSVHSPSLGTHRITLIITVAGFYFVLHNALLNSVCPTPVCYSDLAIILMTVEIFTTKSRLGYSLIVVYCCYGWWRLVILLVYLSWLFCRILVEM